MSYGQYVETVCEWWNCLERGYRQEDIKGENLGTLSNIWGMVWKKMNSWNERERTTKRTRGNSYHESQRLKGSRKGIVYTMDWQWEDSFDKGWEIFIEKSN